MTTQMDKVTPETMHLMSIDQLKLYAFGGKAEFSMIRDDKTIHVRILKEVGAPGFLVIARRNWLDSKWIEVGRYVVYEADYIQYRWVYNSDVELSPPYKLLKPWTNELLFWFAHVLLKNIQPNVKFYRHNRCARCYRPLIDAASVSNGFGPVCWKKIQ